MEWKDTIMSDNQIAEVLREECCKTQGRLVDIRYFGASPNDRVIAKAQAELSFGAGYEARKKEMCDTCDTPLLREGELYQKLDDAKKQGIKEVVDYFNRHWAGGTKGVLFYEVPAKDQDLLEGGIIPENGEQRKPSELG